MVPWDLFFYNFQQLDNITGVVDTIHIFFIHLPLPSSVITLRIYFVTYSFSMTIMIWNLTVQLLKII